MSETGNMTTQVPVPVHRAASRTGRYLWCGMLLAIAVVAGFVVQIAWANWLITPWYLPLGGTLAAMLVVYAWSRNRTWGRAGATLACVALACLEWLFVIVVTVLPAYHGPVKPGSVLPPFHARLADGTEITDLYFRQHPATAVVFFQGRWCPFCVTQLRELEAHHEEFDRSSAKVLAVSLEGHDLTAQTQREFPHLVIVSDEGRELSNAVEVINRGTAPDGSDCAIPTILLLDQSGTVRWLHRPERFIARPSAAELAARIKAQNHN